MLFHLLKLINSLRLAMFHVKHLACKMSKFHKSSTKHLFFLLAFFLSAFFFANSVGIDAEAKDKLALSNVTLNGISMNDSGDGVYTLSVGSSDNLRFQFYSGEFEKLTEYNLKVNISFTYPQTTQTYLNITPFYRRTSGEFVYLAQIGNILSNGNKLTYHTKDFYDDDQPNVPPFSHGGYCTHFGSSSYTSGSIDTDLTYYFGENDNIANIGLFFETGVPGSLSKFPSSQRTVTVTIECFDAVEKATIENAETTKNIFEWLQDGFVALVLPTSDGIEDMLNETSSTLESRLGILYLPIEFTGNLFGSVSASLEQASSGHSITVPEWKMAIFGRNYTLWHETSFSISENPLFQHITSNQTSIILLRILYLVATLYSVASVINVLTGGMYDDEFIDVIPDNEGGDL